MDREGGIASPRDLWRFGRAGFYQNACVAALHCINGMVFAFLPTSARLA